MSDPEPPITLDFIDGKLRKDIVSELRHERDYYRMTLEMIAQHDWQFIGSKGATHTLEAVAEMIDTARRALGRPERGDSPQPGQTERSIDRTPNRT